MKNKAEMAFLLILVLCFIALGCYIDILENKNKELQYKYNALEYILIEKNMDIAELKGGK